MERRDGNGHPLQSSCVFILILQPQQKADALRCSPMNKSPFRGLHRIRNGFFTVFSRIIQIIIVKYRLLSGVLSGVFGSIGHSYRLDLPGLCYMDTLNN